MGSSAVLESYEPVFQQDLNGDGQIGAQATIESFGATRLVQVADAFLLHDSAGNGPSLKQQDVAVVPGQFDAWTPIGAEAAETGYLVAWKNGAADEFTVWNTDGSGNYLWDPIGTVVGSSAVLESYEPVFQQDLNGDGTAASERHLSREMTAADMAGRDLAQRRRLDLAARRGVAAARMEVAA